MTMRPGHENCPDQYGYDIVEETTLGGDREVYVICGHHHSDPVQAIDGTNTGPIVADYCNCCGAMRRRKDYR